MAFVNERTEAGKYITVDREKGLLLTRIGQIAAEPIYIFEFTKDKKSVQVFIDRKILFKGDDRTIVWTVKKIFPDVSFEEKFFDFQSNVSDALLCYGASGAAELHPEGTKEVIVEFAL